MGEAHQCLSHRFTPLFDCKVKTDSSQQVTRAKNGQKMKVRIQTSKKPSFFPLSPVENTC